ncbi:MAG: hypothetical protein R3C68_09485 [Myxococcota bacterium]
MKLDMLTVIAAVESALHELGVKPEQSRGGRHIANFVEGADTGSSS